MRICRKSPVAVRCVSRLGPNGLLGSLSPSSVKMCPRCTKCSPALIGAVHEAAPSSVWAKYRLQSPSALVGPPVCPAPATESVPYHARSARPESPAAIHANTLLCSAGVGTCDTVHVAPWSCDTATFRMQSPVTANEPWLYGASSHTT